MAGLFDYQSPENMRAARLQPLLVSGAQMGQQPLLSQLVSQMSNAGANLGSAGAGMLGLQLPEEAAQQRVKDIMQGVGQDDVEGLRAASQKFADIGDTQRANALIDQANKAETLGFARQDRKTAQDQIKAAATQKEGLITALTKRDPNMSPEVAAVLAGDSKALLSYLNPDVKTAFKEVNGRIVLFNSDTGIPIRDVGAATPSDSSLIAGGLGKLASSLAARKAGEGVGLAEGKAVSAAYEQARLNETQLGGLQESLDLIDKGIYAGGYGAAGEKIAQLGGGVVGDKEKLARTQVFRSNLGSNVLPMMQALGGSDTIEELNFVKDIVGANTTYEPEALKTVIQSFIKKIGLRTKLAELNMKRVLNGDPALVKLPDDTTDDLSQYDK